MKYQILTREELVLLEPFETELDEEELSQYLVSKGFYDKDFFCQYFLGGYGYLIQGKQLPTPQHHKEIWEYLDKKSDFNLIEPRGHGKTTAILEWILRAICYEQEKSILYIANQDLGKQGLGKIRGELENNDLLLRCFGNVVPINSDDLKDKRLKRWKQQQLEFLNWIYLVTMTKGQAVRGQRPTKIIFDDPQENKDVMTKAIVDKFNTRVFSSLYNTLLPWWSMTVLGTIVGNLCLVLHLKQEKKWPTLYREACDSEFNNVLWPELWDKASLMDRKEKVWTPIFNQEFRHIPLNREDALIIPEWIQYYEERPTHFDRIIMAVDPIKKASEKSDFMGIAVAGIIGDQIYVLFSKGIRLSSHKAERFIQLVYEKYKPDIILQEDNIEVTMIDNLKRKGLPIKPISSTKDKYTRLLNVQPSFENLKVFFRTEKDSDLIWQLTNFPDVDHDDIMDALVFILLSIKKKKKVGITLVS